MKPALSLLLAALTAAPAARAQDPLKVVTTITDLAAITRSIGGDAVEVEHFVRAGDDPHQVLAKPSMLLKLSRADAVIVMGLNYEHAFMPALLQKLRQKRVKPGGPGYLELGSLITPLEVPDKLDRGQGADLHPFGNPHFNLDPENGRLIARAIRDHLATLRPERRADFERNWKAWDERARALEKEWQKLLAPYRGAEVLAYHNSWPYFLQRYGLVLAGTVEPKPGMAPSARHLAEIASLAREHGIRVLLIEPWYDARRVSALSSVPGLKVVSAAATASSAEAGGYLEHLDRLIRDLADALAER